MEHALPSAPLAPENVALPRTGGRGLASGSVAVGVVGLAIVGVGLATGHQKHALASLHVGGVSALAVCLGALFWVMVFHLTNAGWCATVRRQFENVAGSIWVPILFIAAFVVGELTLSTGLCSWLNPRLTGHGEDVLFQKKAPYLNVGFAVIRLGVYFLVWIGLSRLLVGLSRRQDESGDHTLTVRAGRHSAWGMLAFALTASFFGFDWLMALADYKFFSTMWGVYFFSGAAVSSLAAVTLVLAALRGAGKLDGVVTEEHLHDLGKLLIGFTIFWAYIAFFQYFLIWYGNIPEETAFFVHRTSGGWGTISGALAIGHFVIPFFVLLWRKVKRSMLAMVIMSCWVLAMQVLDVYWVIRPAVYAGEADPVRTGALELLLDAGGVLAAVGLLGGALVLRVRSGPLIPLRDPRLGEALAHRNYV